MRDKRARGEGGREAGKVRGVWKAGGEGFHTSSIRLFGFRQSMRRRSENFFTIKGRKGRTHSRTRLAAGIRSCSVYTSLHLLLLLMMFFPNGFFCAIKRGAERMCRDGSRKHNGRIRLLFS